ncbi:hypothetical protein HPB47_002826 [Ixodes persulcatus]|uniref:Uncharacterized protein n=1 Tax=Ixodes persulcatus TaxID=34615 RepID=A0AC60PL95_IXOPE|nr:hypothetical protein HPB47_002826 [Ixodes persulcatus]
MLSERVSTRCCAPSSGIKPILVYHLHYPRPHMVLISTSTFADKSWDWVLTDEEIAAILDESDADLSDAEDPEFQAKETPGNQDPAEPIHQCLLSPHQYFMKYFPADFWEECATQTNLYSIQKRNHRSVKTNIVEVKKLAEIHLRMGVMGLPRVHMYWSRGTRTPLIADSMTRNRFYELRNHLDFVDYSSRTDEQNKDKLYLVRPILDHFQMSIDEKIIPFLGRCSFRHYLHSTPNPVGLKNFVLASPGGLGLDFLIYTRKGIVIHTDMKAFGLGGALVKKLMETVISKDAHAFTDRYFMGLKIIDFLLKENKFLTGTVNANRTEGAPARLPSDKDMTRGQAVSLVGYDGKVCLVKWRDNKSVLLLSIAVGTDPMGSCRRWSKEDKKKIPIPQSAIVSKYNRCMGESTSLTDLLLTTEHKFGPKSGQFEYSHTSLTWPSATHGLSSFLRDDRALNVSQKKRLPLPAFKQDIAETPIRANVTNANISQSELRGSAAEAENQGQSKCLT